MRQPGVRSHLLEATYGCARAGLVLPIPLDMQWLFERGKVSTLVAPALILLDEYLRPAWQLRRWAGPLLRLSSPSYRGPNSILWRTGWERCLLQAYVQRKPQQAPTGSRDDTPP